jgi:hypothetical protein
MCRHCLGSRFWNGSLCILCGTRVVLCCGGCVRNSSVLAVLLTKRPRRTHLRATDRGAAPPPENGFARQTTRERFGDTRQVRLNPSLAESAKGYACQLHL